MLQNSDGWDANAVAVPIASVVLRAFAVPMPADQAIVVDPESPGGVNSPHGSLFWFHNDNHLNSLSNTDKLVKPTPTAALFRIENQFGGSFGIMA